MPRPPISDWTQVKPGEVYTSADVCALLRIHPDTLRARIKAGRISTLPRENEFARLRFQGSDLLDLNPRAATITAPSETKAEGDRRALQAMDRIRQRKPALRSKRP